jgi:MarR family 2-MHQ and catechol resistance regulon transcriptional repressor
MSEFLGRIRIFMKKDAPEPIHVFLVMLKAMKAITRYAGASVGIEQGSLCESDFRVLEVLLHKGPLPVNTIGSKVDLTPGSISVAVDRLHSKGLVSRCEDEGDRRVRNVALTGKGKQLIGPVFRDHAEAMKELFSVLNPEELAAFEAALKRVGLHAEALNNEEKHERA